MSAALSLHLALHLVPYLDPANIACARRVCKAWYSIFSSGSLAQVALRVHFPLCREILSPSQPLDYSIYNRISRRYAILKSGVPRQELRVPISKSGRNAYIWTFSENILVLQSSCYPRVVLTLIYLDARAESRRIISGELVLGDGGGIVTGVKVCRNMLLVERDSGRAAGSQGLLCSVDCFRLSLSPGDSEVIATKVSNFDTFRIEYPDFEYRAISDHSGKYYAACSKDPRNEGAVQIWDIETGGMVRRIPASEFPKILSVRNVLVIAKQGPHGPQQVVVAGDNRAQNLSSPGEWGCVTDFKVFPIDARSPEWTGCIAEHKEQGGRSWSPTRGASLLARFFKIPRWPTGITSPDTPDTPGYLGEEIGLTLWDPGAGYSHSLYHRIIPSNPPTSAPDVPLAVEREFRISSWGPLYCSPFTVDSRSGLSLAMSYTGDWEYSGEWGLLHQLSVRSFYPSATPGVMDLEWETRIRSLRSSKDKGKPRGRFSTDLGGSGFDKFPLMMIDGDELATALLDSKPGGMDLVLLLWDDEFHGELPLGGKVLSEKGWTLEPLFFCT